MLEPTGSPKGRQVVTETWNRKRTPMVKGRLIVKLKAETGEGLASACDSVMGYLETARVVRPPGPTRRMVVLVDEKTKLVATCNALAKRADVEWAEPDIVDRAQIVPNDPRYVDQWAPPKVNAEDAWDLETGEANVVIGIIDSGISMTGSSLDHDDLSTAGRFILGTDFFDGGTPRDLRGHGTHVAGIAAAASNNSAGIAGMNWVSPVYICRTLDAAGNGSSADFADAVEEITDWAVANGKKAVINYSGGGANNQTKQDAAQYASDNGMLLVAAAGNDNGGPVIWPAAYSTTITGVIAVGSTTSTDTVSSFSNMGPEITVVAPGSDILSTTPTYSVDPSLPLNYGTMSGTSMATPLVTGLAALMWSRHPSFTNAKVKQCLQDTAVKLGSGSFNNSWGHGRVDALAALKCGDSIIPDSALAICGEIESRITLCRSQLVACVSSRLVLCESRLPRLCPSTRIPICIEIESRVGALCGGVDSRICPSFVDACPSSLGCPFERFENPVINPVIGALAGLNERVRALEAERWRSGTADAGAAVDSDWFYVDDEGKVHGWSP